MLLKSPSIAVKKGDILEITARIRMGSNVRQGSASPLFLFDSDLGPDASVTPRLSKSWQSIRFYREVSSDNPLKIWIGLNGAAEVFLDDIAVNAFRQPQVINQPEGAETPDTASRVQGAGYTFPSLP